MTINFQKLLRGYYELEWLPQEVSPEQRTLDFAGNVLNTEGLLYRPIVDEYRLAHGAGKPIWPENAPFAVCLTHDVDAVSQHSLRQSFRVARYHLFHPYDSLTTVKKIGKFFWDVPPNLKSTDPLHHYERWLEFEQQVNARSTFFFWPGWDAVTTHHVSDCDYNLSDRIVFDGQRCSVAEMMREIDRRGWEIGLHPSWYAFHDADELKRQKAVLEDALGRDVVSVRQHTLRYDMRVTPRVHAEAGFQYDSTLGFNDNVGFRFGTCYPWRLYDIDREQEISLMEIPLIIQDTALLNPKKGMRLDPPAALRYVTQIADRVKQVGGVLTLLWHPNRILEPGGWWESYQETLSWLHAEKVWFAPVQEVGQWWKDHQREFFP